MKEKLKVNGVVHIQHYNKDGKLLNEIHKKNLVVDTGTSFIISRMYNNSPDPMSHMAIGSDADIPTTGDVALGSEIARVSVVTTTTTNEIIFVGTYSAGVGTGLLQEAGIFNSNSGGTMLNRVTYGSINKEATDSVVITWTLTLG